MMFPVPKCAFRFLTEKPGSCRQSPGAIFQIAPGTQGTTQDTSQTQGNSQFLFSGGACLGGTCSMTVALDVLAVDRSKMKYFDFPIAVSLVV